MSNEKGNLYINSENFLPIIKKWLYTDKDIFIRELVSNGCDAVTKLNKLMNMGKADHIPSDENFYINVTLDAKNSIIKITDNGIGMTHDEIKQYINQIAFSGATDFIERYEKELDKGSEIIGHFGLGFYSAFMVADRVEIDTLSYAEGSKAANWICEGGIDYEMATSDKIDRGTTITLYISEDGKEFLSDLLLRNTLNKYCAFMPVEIYFESIEDNDETDETSNTEKADDLNTNITESETLKTPSPINDTHPLWLRDAKDLIDEDYKSFYHKVFFDMNDPLFWIHLNMDYPFRLKGILYFPKYMNEMEVMEGEVKLYSNQVYIADNIKEVIPEFLLLLKGVIDCPDLPLNVSRSMLQNDGYANKMSGYITKKVADKLNSLYKNDRLEYENLWDNISLFVKYGSMREEKFYDKVNPSILFKTTENKYKTLVEYLESNKDKHENKVFYVSDETQQIQYINMFKSENLEATILSEKIDTPFVSFLEHKESGKIKFLRIDADISELLVTPDTNETEDEKKLSDTLSSDIQSLFRGVLGQNTLVVKTESLKSSNVPAVITISEESRRMMEMKEAYKHQEEMLKLFGDTDIETTLILNKNNNLVKQLIVLKDSADANEYVDLFCKQIYDLALMNTKTLTSEEMSQFITRSNLVLERLAELKNNK